MPKLNWAKQVQFELSERKLDFSTHFYGTALRKGLCCWIRPKMLSFRFRTACFAQDCDLTALVHSQTVGFVGRIGFDCIPPSYSWTAFGLYRTTGGLYRWKELFTNELCRLYATKRFELNFPYWVCLFLASVSVTNIPAALLAYVQFYRGQPATVQIIVLFLGNGKIGFSAKYCVWHQSEIRRIRWVASNFPRILSWNALR